MQETAQLAGFLAAHGILCVSDGEILIPMAAFQNDGGTPKLARFVYDTHEASIEQGKLCLQRNGESADRGVLVYDGRITLPSGKCDALIVEARQYRPSAGSLLMAVPYRAAGNPDGFAVYRPKFIQVEANGSDVDELADHFFAGVDQHEDGAAVWNAHLDQSQ